MNKKLICIAITALMLTACSGGNSRKDGEENGDDLIESFTEEQQMPLPESGEVIRGSIELALFDPFYDKAQLYRDDESLQDEMRAAARKIYDGFTVYNANVTGFSPDSTFDTLWENTEELIETVNDDCRYYPINPVIAETEDELFEYVKSCLSYSDDDIRKALFGTDDYASYSTSPRYKTIGGTLCARNMYNGVMNKIYTDKVNVLAYNGNTAEIAVYCTGVAEPPSMAFMNISNSEEYGWRLDSIEYSDYWQTEAQILYNAVTMRTDMLNQILGGGNTPENPMVYTDKGELYTETDLDMTIEEMRDFFTKTFSDIAYSYTGNADNFSDGSFTRTVGFLENYISTYIDDVYAEQSGILYRKDNAPRWYLPELKINAFNIFMSPNDKYTISKQEFYDPVSEQTFEEYVAVSYVRDWITDEQTQTSEYVYRSLYISSELPILSYDDVGAELIEIESYDIFSGENTVELDDDAIEAIKNEVIIPRLASSDFLHTYIPETEDIHIIDYKSSPSVATAAVRRNFHHPSEVEFTRVMEIENGWRTSGTEMRECYDLEVSLLRDILTENQDTWNLILGGGVPHTNTVEVDGEMYTENEMNMTVSEMRKFFEDNLSAKLCEEYTEKYIDDVYSEQDGILYRRDSAPLLYLLPYQPDPYNGMISAGTLEKNKGAYSEMRQDFYDSAWGEYVGTDIRLVYRMPHNNRYTADEGDYMCRYFVYERYIDSELPIRERQIVPDK